MNREQGLSKELTEANYAINRAISEALELDLPTQELYELRDKIWDIRKRLNPELKD